MSKFIDALETELNPNIALTENGAVAFRTTKSNLLDFFAVGGALRTRTDDEILRIFEEAFIESNLYATKTAFYFRDVRGGQGERRTFRTILHYLAKTRPNIVKLNLELIPGEYGRWDDLYVLVDTPVEKDMFALIRRQFEADMNTDHPSLLGKWLKSENTSSKESVRLARKTRTALGLSARAYRKALTQLRKKINVVESLISSNKWEEVNYEHVPSKAGLMYRKAFWRHDKDRYSQYIDAVASGEKKINVKDLYPYEIVEKTKDLLWSDPSCNEAKMLDVAWNNLPNYFEGGNTRGIVVADVSGSMSGRPMDVSVSLALYTAERNTGPFHNKFITFSAKPELVTVKGTTLIEKVRNIKGAHWEMNTNIEAVFDLILKTAVRARLPQEELPTHLYIVSDMEFDAATSLVGRDWEYIPQVNETLMETIKKKFDAENYKMPMLVFWNVNSRNDQQPMSMDQRGFQLVSGCSPSIFTKLMKNETAEAYDLMLDVLDDERYSKIRVI